MRGAVRGWRRLRLKEARLKEGAGGGQAEERAWARGRGMRLLKIGGSRTQMRVRDSNLFLEKCVDGDYKYPCMQTYLTEYQR
jgi:hypothetical protein